MLFNITHFFPQVKNPGKMTVKVEGTGRGTLLVQFFSHLKILKKMINYCGSGIFEYFM